MTHADFNIFVAGLIDDLASLQASIYPRRAYERAARSVALLDMPLTAMNRDAIAAIPHIGRTALRVVHEALATGGSPTVSTAIRNSGRVGSMDERRQRREGFISLSAARMVLNQRGTKAVGLKQYRGDFQMHSEWSDGARPIAEMAIACADRGYEHFAVTDHSAGLSIANGLSAASIRRQHHEMDALNKKLRGRLTVLKGIEANILADGIVDVPLDQRRACDIVLAAPHSVLDSDADQTSRLLRAVESPHVHVLAHPSGRKFGKRPGLSVRWDRIFTAAKQHRVAIEIDGDPSRQDLPYALVVQALAAGCVFSIDSDAHDVDQLVYAEIGLAHARLAGVPPARIINCWPTNKLLAWLKRD